jgi:hypothetical protein
LVRADFEASIRRHQLLWRVPTMPKIHATLSRQGRRLGAHELIPLRNGSVIPAGVFKALSEAYVELMRQKGILTVEGALNPAAMLDSASAEKVHEAAEREAAAARRPGSRALAPTPTAGQPVPGARRPPVPQSDVISFDGRFKATFGDAAWVQVDVDARSSAAGSGNGGRLGAELALGVTLPGLGRVRIVGEDVDVAVINDVCTTRSELDPLGPIAETASNPNNLRNPTPWKSRHSLGRTQVHAYGIPIDVAVDVVGAAGISCRGTASSAFQDRRVSQGIMEATLGPKSTTAAGTMAEGLYARLRLEGSSEIELSLRAAIDALSQVDPELNKTVTDIVNQIPGLQPWTWNVGRAGASLSMQLAGAELSVGGFHRLDFADGYVQSGAIDARLRARFLADPSIKVFLNLSLPAGIDVDWDFAPVKSAWRNLSDEYPVWGWPGAAFDDEISIIDEEWSAKLGSARATSEIQMTAGHNA